jgi:hypothetical protein
MTYHVPGLAWITPAGTIANLSIGNPQSVSVLAIDSTNNDPRLTYQIISGNLPPGMTMSNNGKISGTPESGTSVNNYFTTLDYNFVVRVSTTNPLTPVDRAFTLILTNKVNKDFTWTTPAGSLGTVVNGDFYQLPLHVKSNLVGDVVTFKFVSGELPPGMQIVAAGYLQGVPTLSSSIATGTSGNFRFTIRATNSQGHVYDRAFSLSVTNVYGPVIKPYSENVYNLGTHFDGTYYSQQLTVIEPNLNTSVTWSNIGALPPGITLSSTGLLSGYILPTVEPSNFGIAGYDAVSYTGPVVNAGSFIIGQEYLIDSAGTTDFTLIGAQNNNNKTGFIATGVGAGTGVAYIADQIITISKQNTDIGTYDFNQTNQTISYSFTIRAFDGANYDLQNYVITVISRLGFTADSTNISADNTFLPVDSTNTYTPVLLNASKTLPTSRAGSYYAFKFQGYDFQGDTITYSLAEVGGSFDAYVFDIDAGFDYGGTGPNNGPEAPPTPATAGRGGVGFDSAGKFGSTIFNLPGLILDAQTGWIYGKLDSQNTSYQTYNFGVKVSKTRDGVVYSSQSVYFKLPVLGDVNNVINWVTPSNLGTIDNGSISEIALKANSIEGRPLVYTLVDAPNVPIRLPQGLELISTRQNNEYLGLLSGRVSFETFSVDNYATVFDGNKMTIDKIYTFTVQASTNDAIYNDDGTINTPPSAYSIQEFTLVLNVIDREPYDNLYLEALPAWDQRQIFNSVISNTEIFVPELIYRPNDPWFGITSKIEMLFLAGLQADDLNTYANAMIKNHYTKAYSFGDIKTAAVLDNNYNVKYEVVYINIIDPEELSTVDTRVGRKGPSSKLDLTTTIANPYIDDKDKEYKIVYPNSSENMIKELTQNVGYYDQSSLPAWMTSNQPSLNYSNKFNAPLGFTKAVVLAYTIPGASKLIAYRLRNSGINFNNIDFTVDRYLIDDVYTTNFNTTKKVYQLGKETTFDKEPNINIGKLVFFANYAVTVPYDQINGRPVSYIQAQGGIDKIKSFKSGDTLVFVKQENFLNPGPYDGWVNYSDAYIGDNIITPVVEGYDGIPYDKYTVIPGYLEKETGTASVNQRGGVWQINIVNDIAILTSILEVNINERVRITAGGTYGGAILYYDQTLSIGQTVPYYKIYKLGVNVLARRTTFNADTTKFFNHRDQYYKPGISDHYLKFPQYGVFK